MIDRIKTFEKAKFTKCKFVKPIRDIILVNKKVLSENGKVITISEKIVDNTSDKLESIPAYTTSIEYMQMFGTLNDNKAVHIPNFASSENMMSEREIMNNVRDIIKNNYQNNYEKIDNEDKNDVENKNNVEPKKIINNEN